MREVTVTPRWDHYAVRDRMDVDHAATIEEDGSLYVWCYGPTTETLWMKAAEGAVVTCLTCLAYGPRLEWSRKNYFGQRAREEMSEGVRYMVFDPETGGRG